MSTVSHRIAVRDVVVTFFVLAVVLVCGANAGAQMLARPGWQGSGLTREAWWHRPVVYEIDARTFAAENADGVTGLKGIVEHLDYLRALGVDAILFDALSPPTSAFAPGGDAKTTTATDAHIVAPPIDPALGTLDDFDTLSLEASRRNIRVLLTLRASDSEATDLATARFWLNRGVAGFHLVSDAGAIVTPATRTALQQLLRTFFGARILISDAAPATSPTSDPAAASAASTLHSSRGTRAEHAGGIVSPSSEPVLLGSLLKVPSPGTAASQQQAAVAVATQLHAAFEESLSLPTNQLPLLATDSTSEPPSITRFHDALGNLGREQPGSEAKDVQQRQIAEVVATVLFGTRASVLMHQGQEIGLAASANTNATGSADPAAPNPAMAMPWQSPSVTKSTHAAATTSKHPLPNTVANEDADPSSLLNVYRQLSQLHHGNSAMRDGAMILLDHSAEGVVAWVMRPKTPSLLTPAIVVLLNLSATPTTLSLKAELTKLQLRGSFLRTVLRTDAGMGTMNLTSMTLPPYTVYIGQVQY